MTMKLYVTMTSPYARLVRIVLHEKALEDRVEVIPATTRQVDSPYYRINPSGRVPFLVREDAPALEGARLICAWLDQLDGAPGFELPTETDRWEALRLEEFALALMDGLAVWERELYRPEQDRSDTIIAHEAARATRLLAAWEREISHPHMNGPLNMAQIMLVAALDMDRRNPQFSWRDDYPGLLDWIQRLDERPSVVMTRPTTPISVA